MNRGMRAYFLSPALPAVGLLFGMVFCLAISYFAGLRWLPMATTIFYGVFFVWVAALAWQQRSLLRNPGIIDKLFWAFVWVILASLLLHDIGDAIAQKYLRFLPFMVVLPYICGRMMRPRDIQVFANILAWAGPLILMLAITDYWANLAGIQIYSRWIFFGYDHTPLLIGLVLSGSMIALSFHFFTTKVDQSQPLSLHRLSVLIAVGVVAVAIVLIAARGALLGGLLGIVCMVLTMRHLPLSRRVVFLLYVSAMIGLTSFALPKAQAELYAGLMTSPDRVLMASPTSSLTILASTATPILGKDSCRPFEVGNNSVAMRWVLYQEAVTMLKSWPWTGVGAALFGRNSCTGAAGFPHSTLLQSFSELGIVGGLLFVVLISTGVAGIARKVFCNTATQEKQVAQLTLALLMLYLGTDQIYGNYFMAVGSYFLIGVSASMQSNPVWNNPLEGRHA